MSTLLLQDRVRGCLAGVALGDALGMPVEMMTREQILQATGGQGVEGFLSPIQTRISGTRNLPAGSTTDDTQLTLAVARSLLRCGEYNAVDQAIELVTEFCQTRFGWGRATQESAQELQQYLMGPPRNRAGRDPETPAPPPAKPGAGCGNGVAMKVAPLAVFHALRDGLPEPFLTDVMALGLMTHGDPRASFAAAVVGVLLGQLILRPAPGDGTEFVREAEATVEDVLDILEFRFQFFRNNASDKLSARFAKVWSALGDADALRASVGTGCFALESVPFAVGVFLRHPTDFRAAALEAVNAGGDTDSTASIAGALVGANVGLAGIPPEWLQAVPSVGRVLAVADRLARSADAG